MAAASGLMVALRKLRMTQAEKIAILITSYIWPIYKTFSISRNPFIEIFIEIFIRTAATISLQLGQCTTYRRIYSTISL